MIKLPKVNMSKSQKYAFNKMQLADQLIYLATYAGKHVSMSSKTRIDQLVDLTPKSRESTARIWDNKGDLLNFWRKEVRTRYDVTAFKKPDSTQGWYGVEIECYLPKAEFGGTSEETECDGSCRDNCECGYCSECEQSHDNIDCTCECNDSCGGIQSSDVDYIGAVQRAITERLKVRNVQVVTDGSLNDTDEYFGLEIKVLFKLDNYENLTKICEFLKANSAYVDDSCGLHVHIDSRDLKTKESQELAATKYARAMLVMERMLPESRRNNRYSQKGASFTERYYQVNATALKKHGSIEIRAHSGTIVLSKILNWVKVLDAVKRSNGDFNTTLVDKFCLDLSLTNELAEYVVSRVNKFSKTEEAPETMDVVNIDTEIRAITLSTNQQVADLI